MNVTNRNFIDANEVVQSVSFTVTLAELNAGKTLVLPKTERRLRVVGFLAIMTGTFTTLTDARLSDIAADGTTSVDIATIAVAQMGTGVRHSAQAGTNTLGAGFNAQLPHGSGIQIRKTGSTGAGGTSIDVIVQYVVTNPS